MKFTWKEDGRRIILIVVAAAISAGNIKSFVGTGGLYPGGVTGLTLLIQRVCEMFFGWEIPYTLVTCLLNFGPLYIGYRYLGKKFTLYSCLSILVTSILTDILPSVPITSDILLICIFGGIINGAVISICLHQNATTGGTDLISIYLSKKKGVDTWNLILGLNMVILLAAGLLFGWDKALYSIIFQFASTQVLHMLYKRYQQNTLFIVTDHPKEVYLQIYSLTNHGATIIQGEGSYVHMQHKILYSVVSSEELKEVLKAVKKVDPNSFINVIRTERVVGLFYQKPNE